jgi:cysteine desulfurase/selenocysteine lyase
MARRRRSRRQCSRRSSHAYENEYANVHRGLHFLSNAATDAYEKARETVRRFLNAGSVDEIVFTSNSTAAINTVAYGYGMPNIGEGDEIVVSILEHHSNIVPWHFIRERQGAKLVWVDRWTIKAHSISRISRRR